MLARYNFDKLVGTAIAAAVLGLTTAGSAAADPTDDAFFRKLFADGILFGTQQAIIERAHIVCQAFSTGTSPASMPELSEAMNPRQTALFVADAVQAYCPKYADLALQPN